jgi:ankyrin repeat protein
MLLICTKRSFLGAVRTGDLESVKEHFNSRGFGPEWLSATNEDGDTALITATRKGHIQVMAALIAKGADLNTPSQKSDRTSLEFAVRRNNTDAIRMLLEAKADPNFPSQRPPLHLAAEYGTPETIQLLLKHGADINETDRDRITALHIAATYGKKDAADALIKAGADVNIQQKGSGFTPLHTAAYYQNIPILSLLLEKGAKTDIVNNEGKTALDVAKNMKRGAIVQILQKHMGIVSTKKPPAASWIKMGDDKIAHVETFPELKRRLTEIFNFSSRERITLSEKLRGEGETISQPQSFDDISQAALRRAYDAFIRQNGKADEDFVFKNAVIRRLQK